MNDYHYHYKLDIPNLALERISYGKWSFYHTADIQAIGNFHVDQ